MRLFNGLGASSAVSIAAMVVAGCFGNSTSGGSPDGGPPFGFDSGFAPDGSVDGSLSATLSTAKVDFGLVDCGSQPTAKTYSFQNTGAGAITWSAAVDSIFAIQGASSGTVAPGATGSLTLAASAVPTTSTPGAVVAGTLTLTTNVPGFTSVKVPLQLTPQGGSLTLTPALVGLGTASIGTPASLAFTLTNVGNEAVSVAFAAPTDPEFSLTYTGAPAAAMLAPGATLAGGSATFSATSAGAKSATAAIQTTGAMCASAATAVSLSGTGTVAPVSIGPSPLSFDTAPCGGPAAPAQAVTLKSSSSSAITFTASLGLGGASPYAIDVSMGTVAANGQAVINVTPSPIPVPGNITAGFYDDTLTVTTNAPGATPVVIPLQESASGAILALTMATSAFGTVSNTTAMLPFTVTNTGNAAATVAMGTTGANFAAAITGSDVVAAGGGTAQGNASFTAKTNAAATGTLTVTSTSGAVCNVPTAIDLSATGAVPVVTYPGSTQLNLGAICGGALTPATFAVQNTGNAPLILSNIVSTSAAFTVSPSNSTIAPSIAAAITATPVAPVQGTVSGGSSTSGMITFTSNEPGSPTYKVPVTVAYHGANLSFVSSTGATITTLVIAQCQASPANTYTVANTGDLPANVSADAPYPATTIGNPIFFAGTFAPKNATVVPANGSTADAVRDQIDSAVCPLTNGPQTFSNPAPNNNVCIPLPTLTLEVTTCQCG